MLLLLHIHLAAKCLAQPDGLASLNFHQLYVSDLINITVDRYHILSSKPTQVFCDLSVLCDAVEFEHVLELWLQVSIDSYVLQKIQLLVTSCVLY